MTTEEKRIKIAEACGWKFYKECANGTCCCGFPWENPSGIAHQIGPDYFNDLNAMHEAWMILPDKRSRFVFHEQLRRQVIKEGGHAASTEGDIDCCCENATAAQRAEAFGKTLNLW
jgi:hypothetical protein